MLSKSIQAFVEARARRPGWEPIPEVLRPATLADGLQFQHAIHAALEASGDRRVGWKVACTTPASQAGFGLTGPLYAGLMASDQSASLSEALARPLAKPSLECEIAVVLSADLEGTETREQIASAIGRCHIGCEIIDQRYSDPVTVGVPSLVADDFFQVGFVIGAENKDWRDQDLSLADGFIQIDGVRATGSARDGLSVFDSLKWLAGALTRDGQRLRAGDIVLTGTLVRPTPVGLPAGGVSMGITGFEDLRV